MGWTSKFTWFKGMQAKAQQWQPLSTPSMILAHWAVPAAAVARRTARRLGCPYVVWCHGSDVHVYGRTFIGARVLRMGLAKAARVLVASEAMAKELCDRHGFANAQVLPVGIDADFIESPRASLPDWPLKLLWVGERIASKGYQRMLEAVQAAVDNGCSLSLEVIGEGPLERLHAGQEIDIRGAQSPSEVRAAMDRSHLLLLPSHGEGTPLVVQEAMARGLAVAATPVGGIPALFPQQEGWFRLAGNTDSEISESLTKLLMDLAGDPEILGRSRAALFKRDMRDSSRQHCAGKLSKIVSEVLG